MNSKKQRKAEIKVLIALIIIVILLNYQSIDNNLKNFLNTDKNVFVERVIDGDTFETKIGNVRLLGINTPEKGDFFYEESKSFLESEILEKNVTLEFAGERYDKYGRILAYVFLEGKNVNVEMVEKGFANYYFYSGRDKYSDDLLDSWGKCIESNVNLCEKSSDSCSSCIDLSGSSLVNSCSFSCNITNWSVMGEGREKFIFSERVLQPGEKTGFVLDLSKTGGTLFLRDDEGKLVEWKIV